MFRWTVHLEGGPRRVNHAAVAINEKIFSFGGYCTGEDYETRLPIDVHVLDTVSLRWKLIPGPAKLTNSMPYQRYGHSAVEFEENAYIWGGRNDSDGACNILYKYDPVNNQWSKVKTEGSIPGARDGHSACIISFKMYIFGGYEEAIERFSDDVYYFDFATKSWTFVKAKGRAARWRDFHTAAGVDDVMYVFGGRSDLGGNMFTNMEMYCNFIHAFDTRTGKWSQPVTNGIAPCGRRSHSVFTMGKSLYIFGGYNGNNDIHFNDLFRFDAEKNEWSVVAVKGRGPCPRRRQCCCKIDSKVYFFGGTSPNHRVQEDEHVVVELSDLSDLHVLDLQPSLKTLAQMAVLKYKLDTTCLPHDVRWELTAMTTPNVITRPVNTNG